jgi:hypothetical protein
MMESVKETSIPIGQDTVNPEHQKENDQGKVNYKLIYREDRLNSNEKGTLRNSKTFKEFSDDYFEEMFEKLASQAFLKIRQNADIFINLLILMLVSDLPELNSVSIQWVKKALFLNVSEEEATVQFKQEIDHARKQWYRPIDNVIHILQGNRKKKQQIEK